MLLSAFPPLFNPTPPHHHHPTTPTILFYKAAIAVHTSSPRVPPLALTNASTSSTSLRHVSGTCSDDDDDGDSEDMVKSRSVVVAAIRNASTSPVEFVQRIEKDEGKNRGLVYRVLISKDFALNNWNYFDVLFIPTLSFP